MKRALWMSLALASAVWAGPSMEGGTNKVARSVTNSGGDSATSTNNRLVGSVAEEVAFTTASSAGSVARSGWSQLHAFPRAVTDLQAPAVAVTSMTLQWSTPGYDGHDGVLQVGSTYFIRVASYTTPDTFNDHRLANLSFSTSGVSPGQVANVILLGLSPGTTYWARLWTTDGDSNFAYASNISTIVMLPLPAPPAPSAGALVSVNISSITANWSPSVGANSYLLVGSTMAGLSPVFASSSTAMTTATVSGLEPNTTFYLGAGACNPACSAFTALGSTLTLAAPAVTLSTTAVSSTTITLAWGANGNPSGTRFVVRSSTDDATFVSVATVTTASTQLSGLLALTTYYLEIVSLNAAGTPAAASNRIAVFTPIGPIPSAVGGVSATAVLLGAQVSWSEVPSTGTGSGFLHYLVYRSTQPSSNFVVVTTTTATAFTNRPLTLGPTYYFRIVARDINSVDGPQSATVGATPYNIGPMEPLGLQVVSSSASVTLSWSTTTRFDDGTAFISTAAPLADELIGYSVYRATAICASYVNVSSMTFSTRSLTNATGGLSYFYRVFSYNTYGISAGPVTVSSLGERNYLTGDCASRVVFDDAMAQALNAAAGSPDIRIVSTKRPEDIGGVIYQSVSWRALLDGVTELQNYAFSRPVRIVLGFQTAAGAVVPAGLSAQGEAAPASVSPKNLGAYWYNGTEFKKVYGEIDPVSQTVTVESTNLGNYQIRALARSQGGPTFDSSNISGRVLTPNGDGLNDTVIFTYEPGPDRAVVTGAIYDVMGMRVADLRPGRNPNTLVWDGRSGGRVVGGGAYIYRLQGGGKTYTGTIVVAR